MGCSMDRRAHEMASDQQAKEINRLTALLCEVCTKLDDLAPDIEVSEELYDWWCQHQAEDSADREKVSQEVVLKSVHDRLQAQLTDEEKLALSKYGV